LCPLAPRGRNALDRRKRRTELWRCEHASYPVEVISVAGGKKKIAHCLGCGRSGPARAGSMEALVALREEARPDFERVG
jgi:hypothetical protein